jgi:hypothetical protein
MDEGQSFPLHLQPELDQAAALAQSVAHREPTATLSRDPDSLLQSHFFVFNPSSTRRRMASGRDRKPFCFDIQSSIGCISAGGIRTSTGIAPMGGRPIRFFFLILETVDLATP